MDNMQTMDMEYKPWGGLAGVYSGIQQAQTEQSNQNKLAMQGLEGVIKGVQAGRDASDYSNPQMEQLRQQGIMGENKSKFAKGEIDYSTYEGEIKAKIQEQLARMPKAQAEREVAEAQITLNGLRGLTQLGDQVGYDSMQFEDTASRFAQQVGADPRVVAAMKQERDPMKRKQMIEGLMKSAEMTVTMVPSVLQKMAEQKQKGELDEGIRKGDRASAEKIAAGHDAKALQVAQIGADSRIAVTNARNKQVDIISQVQAGKLTYEKAAVNFEVMALYATDPVEKQRYSELAARFTVADQKSRASGRQVPVDLSNLGVQTQQITPTLGQGQGSSQGSADPLNLRNK